MRGKMLKSRKHVFWEALLVTIVIFVIGLLLGISYEASRADRINDYYVQSEFSLMDTFIFSEVIDLENTSCETLISANFEFADDIYEKAKILERYEESGRITDRTEIAHKRYDLLRAFLWINSLKIKEQCGHDKDIIAYFYAYNTEDLAKQATQNTWSRMFFELKKEKGSDIILIPIAGDNNITSLEPMFDKYDVDTLPAMVINNRTAVTKISSTKELKEIISNKSHKY